MTVSSTIRTAGPYPGNGVTASFVFGFKVFLTSQVVVQLTTAGGTTTNLTLGLHYTVGLNADQNNNPGGTVTLVTPHAIGEELKIGSFMAALQMLSIQTRGGWSSKNVEDALDLLTILQQESVGFLRIPEVGGTPPLPFAKDRAHKALTFDADGNPSATAPASGSAGALAADLLDYSQVTNGTGMVGSSQTLAYPLRTAGSIANKINYFDELAADGLTLQQAIDASYGKRLVLRSGASIGSVASLTINGDIEIGTDGDKPFVINTPTNAGTFLNIGGGIAALDIVYPTANIRINSKIIAVDDASNVQPGDLLHLISNKAWYFDPRENPAISPSTDAFGTAQAGSATTIKLKAGTTYALFAGKSLTIYAGTGAGQAREVLAYNPGTLTCTVAAWNVNPDSTSAYRFPQIFKGELHLARAVVGNNIEIEASTWDGYDVTTADGYGLAKEAVQINVYRPLKVSIDNLAIHRPPTLGANSMCISLANAVDPKLTRLNLENGQQAGVLVNRCYRGEGRSSDTKNSNDSSAGYGWQVLQSSFFVVGDNNISFSRRGVDISGNTPSSMCVVEDNTVTGGGAQEDGQRYKPDGVIDNSGVGSHGGARGTIYRRNKLSNLDHGIVIRGFNETIVDNEFSGWFSSDHLFWLNGANLTIGKNRYTDIFSLGLHAVANSVVEINPFGAVNILNYTAPCFLRVWPTIGNGTPENAGYCHISDNQIRDLQLGFVYFDLNNSDTRYDFLLKGNLGSFAPPAASTQCAMVACDTGTVALARFGDSGNRFYARDSNLDILRLGTGVSCAGGSTIDASEGGSPMSWLGQIADDQVKKMRVGQKGSRCFFALTSESTATVRVFGILEKASTTFNSMGANTGVVYLATVPTGMSGVDGNISIDFDGNWLYIENRSGGALDFHLHVFPME